MIKILLFFLLFLSSLSSLACINEDEDAQSEIEIKNNQAVTWIKQGKYASAISMLLEIEKLEPRRYQTATNLGTAYELMGDNLQARRWIAKGIEINPESHNGTEWLHLAILDTKLILKKHPDWLSTHNVINLNETENIKAIQAIKYQLYERVKFVKPKDDIVADLYYTLGCAYLKIGNRFYVESFESSLRYSDLRKREIAKILKSVKK